MSTTATPTPQEQQAAEDGPVVDAEVVEDGAPEQAPAPSTELAVAAPAQTAVIVADNPDEIIAKATKIADSLKRLVEAQGFAVDMGGRKKHLEIGAWQALGAMLGALGGQALHAETVWSRRVVGEDGQLQRTTYHVKEKRKKYGKLDNGKRGVVEEIETEYDVEGYDWEACVEVKTAGGVVIGRSEGMCVRAESSWMKKPDPALKSMAETRAASRAFRAAIGWVVAIAGYNPTPSEEMPPEQARAEAGPPYGPAATDAQIANARAAIGYLFGCEPNANPVGLLLNTVQEKAGGYLPHFALSSIVRVASAVRDRAQRAEQADDAQPGTDDPAGETPEEREERERAEELLAEEQARAEANDTADMTIEGG